MIAELERPTITPKKRKHQFNDRFFAALTPVSAYWLGYVLADGCVVVRHKENRKPQCILQLASKDKEHLSKFLSDLEATQPVQGPYSGTYQVSIYSYDLCLSLEGWGIGPRKSYSVCLPAVTEELMPHMLRGVFDGDGCIYTHKRKNKTYPGISVVGSKPVCDAFQTLFGGGVRPKAGVWTWTTSGTKAIKCLNTMYDDPVVALDRKLATVKEWCDG